MTEVWGNKARWSMHICEVWLETITRRSLTVTSLNTKSLKGYCWRDFALLACKVLHVDIWREGDRESWNQ